MVGIGIAYILFTGTHGNYTDIFLISTIPGILGVLLLFWVKEKKLGKYGTKIKSLAGWRTLHPRLKAFLWVTFIFTLGNSSNQFLLDGYDTRQAIRLPISSGNACCQRARGR